MGGRKLPAKKYTFIKLNPAVKAGFFVILVNLKLCIIIKVKKSRPRKGLGTAFLRFLEMWVFRNVRHRSVTTVKEIFTGTRPGRCSLVVQTLRTRVCHDPLIAGLMKLFQTVQEGLEEKLSPMPRQFKKRRGDVSGHKQGSRFRKICCQEMLASCDRRQCTSTTLFY